MTLLHEIELDMSPLTKNIKGNSSLMLSLYFDPEKTLKMITSESIPLHVINHQNEKGWTFLHYVCYNSRRISCSRELIKQILNIGADVNLKADIKLQDHDEIVINGKGWTPLMLSSYTSNTTSNDETVKLLLEHPTIDVNLQNEGGWTALMMSCENSNIKSSDKTVELLLTHPAINVNLQNDGKRTALMYACRCSKKDSTEKTVELLLGHPSIDVNLQNITGWTALMHASRYSNTESTHKTVELLLTHPEIDVNIQNNNKQTALFLARHVDPQTIKMLLNHPSTDINIQSNRENIIKTTKTIVKNFESSDVIDLFLDKIVEDSIMVERHRLLEEMYAPGGIGFLECKRRFDSLSS